MSFALSALIGMLSTGMNTFRSAADLSINTQIAQRLINEAQQTDFDQLVTSSGATRLRYFDEQGNELPQANKTGAIYHTNLSVLPATMLPSAPSNQKLATICLQIATNPGNQVIDTGTNNRWISSSSLPISCYVANVAGNK